MQLIVRSGNFPLPKFEHLDLNLITSIKESRLQETLDMLACAVNSTDTIKKSHVSHVTCHMSPVTCHLSLTQTATATNPAPANYPPMHSRVVRKDPKTIFFRKRKNHCRVHHKTLVRYFSISHDLIISLTYVENS